MENNNKSAYPSFSERTVRQFGLTKREYFAAMAMQGMLSNGYGDFNDNLKSQVAKMAISQADEILKQLEDKKD